MADTFLKSIEKFFRGAEDEKALAALSMAGGPAAAKFRAQQMADSKAADLARRASGGAMPKSPKVGGMPPRGNKFPTSDVATRLRETAASKTPAATTKAPSSAAGALRVLGGPVATLLSSATTANKGAEHRDPMLTMNFRELMEGEDRARDNRAELQASEEAMFDEKKAKPKAEPKPREIMSPNEFDDLIGKAEKAAPVIPKAIVVEEPKKATGKPMAGSMTPEALFAHTHGGPFDPKSSMDKKKMAAINSMLSKEGSGDLTPNQFALKIYRQK